jgi:delta-1-pyrroline-5-carboxylate synthetase
LPFTGTLLIIFESRPDCLPQIAALCIRSGNGLLLKGGKEADRTNKYLHKLVADAISSACMGKVESSLVSLISRDEIPSLLKLENCIDLIIPRGSNELVQYIKSNTKIPVLGHADGICHVYIDKECDLVKAENVLLDSKTDYPAGNTY